MTLPTPQAVEEAIQVHLQAIRNAKGQKVWTTVGADHSYWDRIVKAAENSIAVLESLPSLRQKAEADQQEILKLRKILAHVPSRIVLKAKEDAGYASYITTKQ